MRQEDIYVFNPEYLLKPDKNRILITRRSSDPRVSDFIGFVHPVYAIILSLFNGEKGLAGVTAEAASFSLYLGESKYKEYRVTLEKLEQLKMRLEGLKKQYWGDININFSGYYDKKGVIDKTPDEKRKSFGERARCSGNFYSFTILPDGKVTICEELYWHPKFIIGDLSRQSIKEVWNSGRALELYNISRDQVRDESKCKSCPEFDTCHKTKGVCWKEVLYAYGDENWDYPDPKCPYAMKPYREYYLS